MQKVSLTEIYDEQGNMLRIEAHNLTTGDHVMDALWDPNDEQNDANRILFRVWFRNILTRNNFETAD